MEIPNYDRNNDVKTNFKRLYPCMPKQTFRMLLVGPSGCGKTNLLIHLLKKPLIYFDCIYLYAKNLEQIKYQDLIKDFTPISKQVGYEVIQYSNDKIIPCQSGEVFFLHEARCLTELEQHFILTFAREQETWYVVFPPR